MRIVIGIGQKWRAKWKRFAGAVFTLLVLAAVAVGGLTMFGSEVLAVWKTPAHAGLASASGGVFDGLLSFDAPVVLSSQLKAQTEEANQGIQRIEKATLLAENWKFTQSPAINALVLSLNLYVGAIRAEMALADFNNFIEQLQSGLAGNTSPLGMFLNNTLESFQGQVNTLLTNYVNTLSAIQSAIAPLIPAALQPPPIPPASPCTC